MSESILSSGLTSDLMVLVNNAQRRQTTYRQMGRDAQKNAKDNPNYPPTIYTERQAAESILADALKDRFEWMTDDINPLQTRRFPKDIDRGPKGREDDPHEERKVMIACLVAFALGRVDWLEMARDILNDLDEMDAYRHGDD
jgi:hypothetical protein